MSKKRKKPAKHARKARKATKRKATKARKPAKRARSRRRNPVDPEIRRLEREAAAGDRLAAERLAILRARQKPTPEIDETALTELELYIENESSLYNQRKSIEDNLRKKFAKGKYESRLAPKLWLYWVDAGAKKYVKEFGGDVRTMFPKALREALARKIAIDFEQEGLRQKSNPTGRPLTGKKYRPAIKLTTQARAFLSAKIKKLRAEGKPQKQAIAVAFALARKQGFKVPKRNPLTTAEAERIYRGADEDIRQGAGYGDKSQVSRAFRSGEILSAFGGSKRARQLGRTIKARVTGHVHDKRLKNPNKLQAATAASLLAKFDGDADDAEGFAKRKAMSHKDAAQSNFWWGVYDAIRAKHPKDAGGRYTRSNPKKGRGKRKNPIQTVLTLNPAKEVRYADLPAALKKRFRSVALKAARFNGVPLADVVFERCPTPAGHKPGRAFVEVGELVAEEYKVRGKDSKRAGYVWRHAAGDNGRGRRKTKAPIIAVDARGHQVLISPRGAARKFSSREGLKG